MAKPIVFTKSISFSKDLIDSIEFYLDENHPEEQKLIYSAEVSDLIKSGLEYKKLLKEIDDGKKSIVDVPVTDTTVLLELGITPQKLKSLKITSKHKK